MAEGRPRLAVDIVGQDRSDGPARLGPDDPIEPGELLRSPLTQMTSSIGLYIVGNYNARCASCVRDLTSSLRKALCRWYSTVLGLMNS
jgi:hypothetical protein